VVFPHRICLISSTRRATSGARALRSGGAQPGCLRSDRCGSEVQQRNGCTAPVASAVAEGAKRMLASRPRISACSVGRKSTPAQPLVIEQVAQLPRGSVDATLMHNHAGPQSRPSAEFAPNKAHASPPHPRAFGKTGVPDCGPVAPPRVRMGRSQTSHAPPSAPLLPRGQLPLSRSATPLLRISQRSRDKFDCPETSESCPYTDPRTALRDVLRRRDEKPKPGRSRPIHEHPSLRPRRISTFYR